MPTSSRDEGAPSVRIALAHTSHSALRALSASDEIPTVLLAMPAPQRWTVAALTERRSARPAILLSYAYVKGWLWHLPAIQIRSWALDSGAFTAAVNGKPVDLPAFTAFARERAATDPLLTEVFALDVIGDYKTTLKDAEWMWKHGVEAIPCWHANEPEHVLKTMARDYPKIAVGGIARVRGQARRRILEQVFARVWPKKIHGFGVGDTKLLDLFPFHSVDASSWQMGPSRYRRFKSMGGAYLRVPASALDLTAELDHYLDVEAKARARWRKAMEVLK